MSSNDHGRKSNTVMAEAFRRAGVTSVPPHDPKAGSRGRQSCIRVSGFRWQFAINHGSEYSAELDLHGCSEDQAYENLETFLKGCVREGYRTVLVVTGKGTGKLKRAVPFWLEARLFKEFVANTVVAAPRDGGNGALYVHLCER